MAQVAAPLQAVGMGLDAISAYRGGKAARNEAYGQAAELEVNAGQEKAYAQRRAIEKRREARLVQSRALALAAAGGSADDPSVVRIVGDIAGRGEYEAMLELFDGNVAARDMIAQAKALRAGGKEAYRAGRLGATSTAISGFGSMYEKYGDFGRKPPPGTGNYGGPRQGPPTGGICSKSLQRWRVEGLQLA